MFLSAWHPVASRRNIITHPGSARENWLGVFFVEAAPNNNDLEYIDLRNSIKH